jgi:hypothetical protein
MCWYIRLNRSAGKPLRQKNVYDSEVKKYYIHTTDSIILHPNYIGWSSVSKYRECKCYGEIHSTTRACPTADCCGFFVT